MKGRELLVVNIGYKDGTDKYNNYIRSYVKTQANRVICRNVVDGVKQELSITFLACHSD